MGPWFKMKHGYTNTTAKGELVRSARDDVHEVAFCRVGGAR